MNRRISLMLLTIFCIAICCPVGYAQSTSLPSRYTFSMVHERIQNALRKGNPVYWKLQAVPEALQGYEPAVLERLSSVMQKAALSGVLQCNTDGSGWLDVAALSNDQRISSFSQMIQGERIGLQVNDEWISTAKGDEAYAQSMLSFDVLSESLLELNYQNIRKNEIPFVTPLYEYGMRLWELASPWVEDNNYLRVSSGATSHGLTYTINTEALRSILSDWANELSSERFRYGLEGTEFTIGIDKQVFDAFVERVRTFTQTVELSKPITINLAFGEGDALRSGKGSGTVRQGNKYSNISYRYSNDISSTRSKQRLTIDFQPKEGDTLVLDMTITKSSNSKTSGEYDISFSANGLFDGLPYNIKLQSQLVNTYQLANGVLTEAISGPITANIKYDKATIADIQIQYEGNGQSSADKRAAISENTLYTTIRNDTGILFKGPIMFSMEVKQEPTLPPAMEETKYIEAMDIIEIETMRYVFDSAQATIKQKVLDAFTPVTQIIQQSARKVP